MDVYKLGGHSKSVATLTVPGLSAAVAKGAEFTGTAINGKTVRGKAFEAADATDTTIRIQYLYNDLSETGCFSGGIPGEDEENGGCFQETGNLTGPITFTYTYDPYTENTNERTIAKFSTSAESKMSGMLHFETFKEYYGAPDFADQIIQAADSEENTDFDRGNLALSMYGPVGLIGKNAWLRSRFRRLQCCI